MNKEIYRKTKAKELKEKGKTWGDGTYLEDVELQIGCERGKCRKFIRINTSSDEEIGS